MSVPMLRSARLKRFRSVTSAEIEFDNPTVMVGPNGSGKSNVADVFAFLADAMALPLQTVFDRRGGFAAVRDKSSARSRPPTCGLAVRLTGLNGAASSARYALELGASKDRGFEVVREQCVIEGSFGKRDWFDRDLRNGFRNGGEPLKPALDLSALSLPLVGGDTRFRPVHRFLSEMRTCRIEPSVLREMQVPDGGVRLRSDGSNAASVLRQIKATSSSEHWDEFTELFATVVPGTIRVEPKTRGNRLAIQFVRDCGRSKPVTFEGRDMSDGALRALGVLAAVFQKPAPSVLVIEHPETTIHPDALGTILDVLLHASLSMQLIVTTHSPDVLDAEWIKDRHLKIVDLNRGGTRVDPISDAPRSMPRDLRMGAGELLCANSLTAATEDGPSASEPGRLPLFQKGLDR